MIVNNCHINSVVAIKHFGSVPINVRKIKRNIPSREKRIYCFDKILGGKPIKKNIGEVCVERNHYSYKIENFLNVRVENHILNNALTSIVKNNSFYQLTLRQKEEINRYILVLLIRTRRYVQNTIEINKFVKSLDNTIFLNSLDYKFGKLNDKALLPIKTPDVRNLQSRHIRLLGNFPKILEDYYWMIYINKTNIPFYTADNPILHNLHIYFRDFYIYEVKFPKTIKWLIFPISPKIILVLFKPIGIPILTYLQRIYIDNEDVIFRFNNKIIYNAEKEVLLSSYDRYYFKKTIAVKKLCLSQKKFNYKVLKTRNDKVNRFLIKQNHDGECMCPYCKRVYKSNTSAVEHINKCIVRLNQLKEVKYYESKNI